MESNYDLMTYDMFNTDLFLLKKMMIVAVLGEDNTTLNLTINPKQTIYVLEGLMYRLITSNHQWNIAKSSISVNKQKYLVYKKI